MTAGHSPDRRRFLRFLAASPLLAYPDVLPEWVQTLLGARVRAQAGVIINAPDDWVIIRSVREALSVFDFQAAARAKLPVQHYVVVNEGVFHQETDIANRTAFTKWGIRPRRLSNFGSVDPSLEVFGVKWEAPLFLCPCGSGMVYPNGGAAVARAAKAKRALRIGGSTGEVTDSAGLLWATTQGPRPSKATLKELASAECPGFVWNIDHGGSGNQLGARAIQRAGVANLQRSKDARCTFCHKSDDPNGARRITLDDSMRDVIGALGSRTQDPVVRHQTWDDVRRTKDDMPNMKLILKGIVTREDAERAVKNGADGIEVSTHGGHSDAFGRGAIECLPEVVEGVGGRVPVFVDSGFRSGADIYKALALGATGVGIGRPHSWALAAFGQEGVETVIELLRRELQVVMADTGASTVAGIRRDSLVAR